MSQATIPQTLTQAVALVLEMLSASAQENLKNLPSKALIGTTHFSLDAQIRGHLGLWHEDSETLRHECANLQRLALDLPASDTMAQILMQPDYVSGVIIIATWEQLQGVSVAEIDWTDHFSR